MTEKITYSINVQVAGGPRISESRAIELEAYDKLHLEVPASAANVETNIQPGGVGLARLLIITASFYGEELTYKINESGASEIELDSPHFFAGTGTLGLLYSGETVPPTTFYFSNSSDKDVIVQILVARDATPGFP